MDVVVVGGGLAGLTAAAAAARAGARVQVLEGAGSLGGRARSEHLDSGHVLNLGPHALYDGVGAEVLDALRVGRTGGRPVLDGAVALHGGRLDPLPLTPTSLATSSLLGWRGRAQVAVAMGRLLRPGHASGWAGVPWRAWLDRHASDPTARAVLDALGRLACYSADPEVDAAVPLAQMRSATTDGVTYLDGGWQRLVQGLADAATAAGAVLRVGAAARRIERQGAGWAVTTDRSRVVADAVVVAVTPPRAARLLDPVVDPAVRERLGSLVPLRMAVLDLALTSLPEPSRPFALGIDQPSYLSVHSLAARLAPPGSAVVHLGRYLDGPAEPAESRAALESLADLVQPGWREVVAHARFLPSIPVVGDRARAGDGGLGGRLPVALDDGLAIAGDWVGPTGWLADAALRSGWDAGSHVTASPRRAIVPVGAGPRDGR